MTFDLSLWHLQTCLCVRASQKFPWPRKQKHIDLHPSLSSSPHLQDTCLTGHASHVVVLYTLLICPVSLSVPGPAVGSWVLCTAVPRNGHGDKLTVYTLLLIAHLNKWASCFESGPVGAGFKHNFSIWEAERNRIGSLKAVCSPYWSLGKAELHVQTPSLCLGLWGSFLLVCGYFAFMYTCVPCLLVLEEGVCFPGTGVKVSY